MAARVAGAPAGASGGARPHRGVHAAGLIVLGEDLDTPPAPACLREDVGRHNCVDKVVGWVLREGRLPAADAVLQVSGRASFELVQKAAMAGIPVLSAVSAPSALAVELAAESGVTVVGFNRGTQLNVYTHTHRVRPVPSMGPYWSGRHHVRGPSLPTRQDIVGRGDEQLRTGAGRQRLCVRCAHHAAG